MSTDALPQSLLTAARKNRLVPFAGAGVSMAVCREDDRPLFPNWKELLLSGADRLRRELAAERAQIVEGFTALGKLLEAAEVLKEGLGGLFADWVRQAVSRSSTEVAPDSLALPRLLWELGSRIVLTTNYDLVLRWACPRAADLEEWSRIPPVSSVVDLARPTVWHLHGSITHPGDLVMTDADYKDLYEGTSPRADAFRTVLRDVLRNNTLLFIGFSFDDAYLQAELAWLQKCFLLGEGRHYVLVARDRYAETQKALAQITGLSVIPYEAHGAPLLEKLEQLRQAASRTAQITPSPLKLPDGLHRPALHTYLDVAQQVNGLHQVPGIERAFPIERIWGEPQFRTADGETPLHKILANRAVVIEAPAGAGKSTLARFVATILARDYLELPCPLGTSWQRAYLGVEPGEVTELPLLVNLRDLDPSHGMEGIFKAAIPTLGEDHLQELQPLLRSKAVAFILDGLDEAPASLRPRIMETVLLAMKRWKGCYFLLTTRPGEVHVLRAGGFAYAALAALSTAAGLQLIERWALALFPLPAEAESFLDSMRAALARTPELRPIMGSPLSVALLCWNYQASRTLPTSKASLYESIAGWLLTSRSDQRMAANIDITTTRATLEAIAFLLLGGIGPREPVAAAAIYSLVKNAASLLAMSRNLVEQTVRVEVSLGSCLLQDSYGLISFWHVSLRDYFAARWLVRCQVENAAVLSPEVDAALRNPAWQECIDIFVGLLTIEQPHLLLSLLATIESSGSPGLPDEIKRVALRSRVLDIAIAHGYRPPAEFRDSLRSEFAQTMSLSDIQLLGMDPEERISAFSTLGALQLDPRLRGRPSSRALPLSPGAALTMGRYPVTVQEFARFVRAGGYEDFRWKGDFRDLYSGHGWRTPLAWDEQKLVPNAPIVGISWHEAVAYCRWLTAEMAGEILARLPTQDEWSLAASQHTLEKELRPHRSSISQSLAPRAPVGVFPERRGPGGHDDMSGSIWEWLGPKHPHSRRRRMQITAWPQDGYLYPIPRKARGAQRSPIVGFRIVFEPVC